MALTLAILFIAMLGKPQVITAAEENTTELNLLVNGNAESEMAGWNDPDNIWFPSAPITPQEGSAFFWPSRGAVENTYCYQDVSVKQYETGTWMELTAWLANWDQYPNDEAVLQLEFLDEAGAVLASQSRSQRNPAWNMHSIQMQLPKGAVTARVKLIAQRYVGSDNDAYFDSISLTVAEGGFKQVYLTGSKSSAQTGDTIQLIADNGTTTDPSHYRWSSSFDSLATVDAKGLVTFLGTVTDEVTIYAQDTESGFIGTYYINSDKVNLTPAPGQVTGVKKENVTTSSVGISWKKTANAKGYLVYQYNSTTKKWSMVKKITSVSTVKATITGLKKGTTYQFKVYAYATYGATTYKGKASTTISIKTAVK